jgi:hypothetical protein
MSEDMKQELRETGYLLAYNDLHKIMMQLINDQNRALLLEMSDRFEHDLEVRKLTGCQPYVEILKD